jgi:hypothetical protein
MIIVARRRRLLDGLGIRSDILGVLIFCIDIRRRDWNGACDSDP